MLRILIAEPSYLLRKGLIQLIEQFQEAAEVEIAGSTNGLLEAIQHFAPDMVLINTTMESAGLMEEINLAVDHSKIIHIINTPLPSDLAGNNRISIYDSKSVIMDKLSNVIRSFTEDADSDSEELTSREKLILKHVALGLTNKEIATKLFISTHTVISHRKNITRKLDIKSVSGLTVYAILNGIISMEDVS